MQDKSSYRKVVGKTQENLFVIQELDEKKLKADLEKVKAKGNKNAGAIQIPDNQINEYLIR